MCQRFDAREPYPEIFVDRTGKVVRIHRGKIDLQGAIDRMEAKRQREIRISISWVVPLVNRAVRRLRKMGRSKVKVEEDQGRRPLEMKIVSEDIGPEWLWGVLGGLFGILSMVLLVLYFTRG